MKARVLMTVFGTALALGITACASRQPAPVAQSSAGEKGSTYLTGSYIPQNVDRNGRITSGANDVQVYGHKDIERSGQSTVTDFLRQQGATP